MTEWSKPAQHEGTMLIFGGRVHVMDGATQPCEALIVRDGRVLAVGTEQDMQAAAGKGARTIDVRGATVMPGLIDTHPHVLHFTARLRASVDLTDAKDYADIVARIRAKAAKTPRGEWIMTTPVGEPHFFIRRSYRDLAERALPDRHVLDQATTDHPVFVQAWGQQPQIYASSTAGVCRLSASTTICPTALATSGPKRTSAALTGVFRGAVNNYYNIDPYWTQILTRCPVQPLGSCTTARLRAWPRSTVRA